MRLQMEMVVNEALASAGGRCLTFYYFWAWGETQLRMAVANENQAYGLDARHIVELANLVRLASNGRESGLVNLLQCGIVVCMLVFVHGS